jgi:hypothetical protein
MLDVKEQSKNNVPLLKPETLEIVKRHDKQDTEKKSTVKRRIRKAFRIASA